MKEEIIGRTFAMDIIERFKLKKNDLVMDIGSNVGNY